MPALGPSVQGPRTWSQVCHHPLCSCKGPALGWGGGEVREETHLPQGSAPRQQPWALPTPAEQQDVVGASAGGVGGCIWVRCEVWAPKAVALSASRNELRGPSGLVNPNTHSLVPLPPKNPENMQHRPAVSMSSAHMQSRQRGPGGPPALPSLGALISFSLVLEE